MEQMQIGIWRKNQTFTVASAPSVTGLVFMRRFRLFWGQFNNLDFFGQCLDSDYFWDSVEIQITYI